MNADWLQDPNSLTQRFRQLQTLNIKHHLLTEGWARSLAIEAQPLQCCDKTWLREITWQHYDDVLIYARTIIPETTFIDCFNNQAIGKQALGDIIFSSTQLEYSAFNFFELTYSQPLFQLACQFSCTTPNSLNARQRTFIYKQRPIIVTEVFLPKFFERELT